MVHFYWSGIKQTSCISYLYNNSTSSICSTDSWISPFSVQIKEVSLYDTMAITEINDPMFSPCESKCPVTVKRTYIKILSPLFWVFSYRLSKTTEDRKHLQLINTIPSLIRHPRWLLNIVISILISIGSTGINISSTGIYLSFNGHPGEYLPFFTSYNPFVHHLFHSQQEWKQVIVSYRKQKMNR